jgi:hypothetical protein
MARTYEQIDEHMREWIARQPMFFIASAPLAEDGHVNVSPKGPGGSLRVLGPNRVAYLDLVGSGAETIAHVRENGRIVVMFCAFEGPPRIVRLHGRGEVVLPGDPRYEPLLAEAAFEETTVPEGRRAIVLVEVARISSSCGYGVPLMDHVAERPHMDAAKRKRLRTGGPDAIERYQQQHNLESIDGLPAVPALDRGSVA